MSGPPPAGSCAIPPPAALPASDAAPGNIPAARRAPQTFRHKRYRIGISQMGGNFHTVMAQPLRSSALPCSHYEPELSEPPAPDTNICRDSVVKPAQAVEGVSL